ncbi:DUF2510 domain-containing protein, partial [Kitasatospora putterlickiae]|uniref:DUF2510 domain-containing protein n=1 Tax=Kitasatospora putterlickiae TaxID=221725 RepID=UPI0031D54B11
MTDRPLAGGSTDTAAGPAPGYYPDPSIPGFVRYWGGSAWVPGTSRPAPAEGEVLEPPRYATRRPDPAAGGVGTGRYVPPPVAAEAAAESSGARAGRSPSGGDSGPVYLDQTGGGASFTFVVPENGPVFRRGGDRAPGAEPTGAGRAFERVSEAVPALAPEPLLDVAPPVEPEPRARRGPMEAGDGSRWVSWGVPPEPVEDPPVEAAAPE